MNRTKAWNGSLLRVPRLLGALLIAALATGCETDEELDCVSEAPVQAPLEVSTSPDLDVQVTVALEQSEGEDGGKRRIMAWDCLDASWWSDVDAQKVVVVYQDLNECEYYESVQVEYYACYSHQGADAPYRDYDEDGLTPAEGDCDDDDASIGDANGDGLGDCLDNDGDSLTLEDGDCDDGDASVGRPDDDGDGTSDCVDDDGDGLDEWAGDCDDGDAATGVLDADADGTSDCADDDKDGYSEEEGDCNDRRPAISPAASEVCDGLDSNCDGAVEPTEDLDGDGYTLCTEGGAAPDCDDQDPARYPGAVEACDGVDNNCDGIAESSEDQDGDGYALCAEGGITLDCDDRDPARNPGASELCDGKDNDCDGQPDDDVELSWSTDGVIELEPNDSLEQAMDLGDPINTTSLELQGAISSLGDEDWFLFRSSDDTNDFWRIELTLRNLAEGSDYVVYLYRADGALLASSRANQDEQFLYYGGLAGVDNSGDYYVRVVSSSGQSSACQPYQLIISAY